MERMLGRNQYPMSLSTQLYGDIGDRLTMQQCQRLLLHNNIIIIIIFAASVVLVFLVLFQLLLMLFGKRFGYNERNRRRCDLGLDMSWRKVIPKELCNDRNGYNLGNQLFGMGLDEILIGQLVWMSLGDVGHDSRDGSLGIGDERTTGNGTCIPVVHDDHILLEQTWQGQSTIGIGQLRGIPETPEHQRTLPPILAELLFDLSQK
mmetsp:Transcript_18161/g.42027  ORF Transcript_18161/g.42027 Transcript_18161/m.42027 type:complete len:205 (-) Transcript_18161:29-643(-)